MTNIIQYPNPILTTRAVPIALKGDTITLATLREMEKYLLAADNAVGLSLPQAGISKRGFVMMVSDTKSEIIINPVIAKRSPETAVAAEGCLSIPGQQVMVQRYRWIDVLYYDRALKVKKVRLSGFAARIFQHELDHLNGITIIERGAEMTA